MPHRGDIENTLNKFPKWFQPVHTAVTFPGRVVEQTAFVWLPLTLGIGGGVLAAPAIGVGGAVLVGAAGIAAGFYAGAHVSMRIFGSFDGNGKPSYTESLAYVAENAVLKAKGLCGKAFNQEAKPGQAEAKPEQKPQAKPPQPQ